MTNRRRLLALTATTLAMMSVAPTRAAPADVGYRPASPVALSELPDRARRAFEDAAQPIDFSNHYHSKALTLSPGIGSATGALLDPDGHEQGTLTLSLYKNEADAREGEVLIKGIVGFGGAAIRAFAPSQPDRDNLVSCVAGPEADAQRERITCIGRVGANLAHVSLTGPRATANAAQGASNPAETAAGVVAGEAALAMFVATREPAAPAAPTPTSPQALSAAGLKSAPADRDTAFHAAELSRLAPALHQSFDVFKVKQLDFTEGYKTVGNPLSASNRFAEFSKTLNGPNIDGASAVTYAVFANPGAASAFILGASKGLDGAWTPTAQGTFAAYDMPRKGGGTTHCFAMPVAGARLDLVRCFAADGVFAVVATIVVAQEPPFGAGHNVADFPVNLAAIVASAGSSTLADQMKGP